MRHFTSLIKLISLWENESRFWYMILAVYMLILGFLSLNPWVLPTSTESVFSPDKLDHAAAYGGLIVIVFFCLVRSQSHLNNKKPFTWAMSLLIVVMIGVSIEIAQSLFTTNRTGSIEDAVANSIGACIGLLVFHILKYIYSKVFSLNEL
jgi:VanZ family protein